MRQEAASLQERRAPPSAVVIFGASGDLTQRKLVPALANLVRHRRVTDSLTLIGVGRSALSVEEFRREVAFNPHALAAGGLAGDVQYLRGAYDDLDTYRQLAELLDRSDNPPGLRHNRLFYLATPPQAFPIIVANLAAAGLNRPADGGSCRIVIEKPFGHDEASARTLDDCVHAAFAEGDVFRIDHYLGKDTVQNVLALRFANSIFQPIWNRSWVDHGQITVAETLGVEGRGSFYENAGATRDILQNHVLQVLALALMEPPASFAAEAVRNEKVKLLEAIRPLTTPEIARNAVRGQYSRGGTRGQLLPGYREEPGVDPLSRTETYAALRLDVDNWRWAGVPFYVRTGKRLPARVTEVLLQFQRPPHLPISAAQVEGQEADALILRIQPDEGITLRFGAKVPGHHFLVRSATMAFSYGATFPEESPEAYERLLLEALVGDPTLFIRSDEVEQCWRIVDPIIAHWANDNTAIPLYEAGSWGPTEAEALPGRDGRSWHVP
jgi:glucose-6-phosphate 1-dehydrogenase